MKNCKVIGLTGGIASGKSTVSRYIKVHNVPVFDADAVGHELMQKQQPAWQDILDVFGADILLLNGEIDRKKLASIVFADHAKLLQLEQIMHKRIFDRACDFIDANQTATSRLIVLDVPLLIEAGWHKNVDEVWLIYLEAAEQIRRATLRDAESAEAIKQRVDKQLSFEEKQRFATHIIDNSGSLENTLQQVDELLKTYKN